MKRERYWDGNKLIRELIDGVEVTENIGKSREQLSAVVPLTFTRKVSHAATAISRVIKAKVTGQQVTVSPSEQARRMAICQGCEFFTGNTCKKCGCVIRFKAKLNTEHCPIQKW